MKEQEKKATTTVCNKFKEAWSLFSLTFKSRREKSKKSKNLLHVLQTRAWILHCMTTILYVYKWVDGEAYWLNDTCIDEIANEIKECPEYNHKFLNSVTPAVRILMGMSIVASLIIDILCYKYRILAQCIIYH